MKKRKILLMLILLAAGCMMVQGKKAKQKPDAETALFKLRIVDSKGKPLNNTVVFLSSDPKRTFLQFNRGVAYVRRISAADTLVVVTGKAIASLPICDLDSARIIIQDAGIKVEPPAVIINAGYGEISTKDNARPVNHLNVSDDPTLLTYRDLASYLQGRVSGLQIVNKGERLEAIIRGVSSFNLSSSALVVIDGQIYESFDEANLAVSLNDIQSIDILKEASIYGSRGANGAILITTKVGGIRKK